MLIANIWWLELRTNKVAVDYLIKIHKVEDVIIILPSPIVDGIKFVSDCLTSQKSYLFFNPILIILNFWSDGATHHLLHLNDIRHNRVTLCHSPTQDFLHQFCFNMESEARAPFYQQEKTKTLHLTFYQKPKTIKK